jgi:hypothetical protein
MVKLLQIALRGQPDVQVSPARNRRSAIVGSNCVSTGR